MTEIERLAEAALRDELVNTRRDFDLAWTNEGPAYIGNVRAIITAMIEQPSEAALQSEGVGEALQEVNNVIAIHAVRTGTSGLSKPAFPEAVKAYLQSILNEVQS